MEVGARVVGSADGRPAAADAGELLQVSGVFKSFGGTEALADVGMRSTPAKSSRCSARTAPASRR